MPNKNVKRQSNSAEQRATPEQLNAATKLALAMNGPALRELANR